MSWGAVNVLFATMGDKDTPPGVKVMAASKILDVALKESRSRVYGRVLKHSKLTTSCHPNHQQNRKNRRRTLLATF